jgi:hypothetical protein
MKPQHLLAGLAWLNWFAVTWLIIFSSSIRSLNYTLACLAWVFFLVIALFASVVTGEPKK